MAELLNAEQMLTTLHRHGSDAASVYNDGEELDGWFGWSVDDDSVLTIEHQVSTSIYPEPKVTRRWRLVPIDGVES